MSRGTYAQACAGYDEDFEIELLDKIARAIGET
jgi:hypothetical protein